MSQGGPLDLYEFWVQEVKVKLGQLEFVAAWVPLKQFTFLVDVSLTEQLAAHHPFQSLYRIILI